MNVLQYFTIFKRKYNFLYLFSYFFFQNFSCHANSSICYNQGWRNGRKGVVSLSHTHINTQLKFSYPLYNFHIQACPPEYAFKSIPTHYDQLDNSHHWYTHLAYTRLTFISSSRYILYKFLRNLISLPSCQQFLIKYTKLI